MQKDKILYLILSFPIIAFGVVNGYPYVVIFPFLITGLFVFLYPPLIPYCFIASFVFSRPALALENAILYPSDLFLVPIALYVIPIAVKIRTRQLIQIPIIKWGGVLFFFMLLSVLLNLQNYSGMGFIEVGWYLLRFISFIFLFLYGYYLANKEPVPTRLITLITTIIVVPLVVAFYQVYIDATPIFISSGAIGTFGWHHTSMGLFMSVPFSLALIRVVKGGPYKALMLISMVLSLTGALISQSRAGVMIMLGVLGVVFFNERKRIGLIRIITLVVVLFSLGLLTGKVQHLYYKTFPGKNAAAQTGSKNIDLSSYSRLILWKSAWDSYTRLEPVEKIFGAGVASFPYRTRLIINLWGTRKTSGAHNIFLHVLFEAGVVGLFMFLFFWGKIIWTIWKNGWYDIEGKVLVSFLIMCVLSGLMQEIFWMNPWSDYFTPAVFFFIGLTGRQYLFKKTVGIKNL